ncbi:MAG TPA: GH116 family glycosyl hydrolase, partial [Oceanipulchritudo sp.]|nr:GH116 family glycosyl hydrolase [Oceanipulchritudo sp.]
LLDGAQHNTLDSDWFGEVAWLSGHYLAAVRAGEQMAREIGDLEFAEQCRALVERGADRLVERLYDPDRGYFINRLDPDHPASVNSGTGCHIDQVFGQSWAFQVGLERVLPAPETKSALRALWKHNFMTDVGPWRLQNKPGRWYAVPGEAGLVMCTFPTPDWDYTRALGVDAKEAWSGMYFNECMTGFEYQVASHMLFENEPDLILKGLAITRAIHDRYSPDKRNPYNEVECSDHYGRAAAGYGVFLAACGFEYSGPEKRIGFAPRLSPGNFRAPFTSAEGWGTYSQQQAGMRMQAELAVRYGTVSLRTLVLQVPAGVNPEAARVTINGRVVPSTLEITDRKALIRLDSDVLLAEGQSLAVAL